MPQSLRLAAAGDIVLAAGDRLCIVPEPAPEYGVSLLAAERLPRLQVGTRLSPAAGGPDLCVVAVKDRPGRGDAPAARVLLAEALADCVLPVCMSDYHAA